MKLTEDQKNQVRKDLIEVQKQVLQVSQAALLPSYLRELAKCQLRVIESLAIACGVFEIEANKEQVKEDLETLQKYAQVDLGGGINDSEKIANVRVLQALADACNIYTVEG